MKRIEDLADIENFSAQLVSTGMVLPENLTLTLTINKGCYEHMLESLQHRLGHTHFPGLKHSFVGMEQFTYMSGAGIKFTVRPADIVIARQQDGSIKVSKQ